MHRIVRRLFAFASGTIWNALRVALRIISGIAILDFAFVALCGALQTHFHRWGRYGKRQLQRRFLRKRDAVDIPDHCRTKQKSHRFCISASTMASYWSGRRGSNSLPPPWQGGALPDELRPHIRCIYPCTLPFLNGAPAKACEARFCGEKEKIWYSSQKSCLQDFPMNDRIFDVVPPIGIEPMTRGFSVPCSTD